MNVLRRRSREKDCREIHFFITVSVSNLFEGGGGLHQQLTRDNTEENQEEDLRKVRRELEGEEDEYQGV